MSCLCQIQLTWQAERATIAIMINIAIRYRPIVEELQQRRPPRVLEVGSGPEGLRLFWPAAVVGVDVEFRRPPLHQAVRASGLALPFRAASFPAVVGCDVLEHVAPPERESAVAELARVAQSLLLLTFPSGEAAMRVYRRLQEETGAGAPQWLHEHLANGLPDADEVAGWLRSAGWAVTTLWYESAEAHLRLLRWELRWPVKLLTYAVTRLFGRRLVWQAPMTSREPELRVLIKAERP